VDLDIESPGPFGTERDVYGCRQDDQVAFQNEVTSTVKNELGGARSVFLFFWQFFQQPEAGGTTSGPYADTSGRGY
jgi:hypothetical protein